MSIKSIESFEKAVEGLLIRQRVGIGFAITELSIKVARKSYPFSSRFLVLARKATEKSPKRKRGV